LEDRKKTCIFRVTKICFEVEESNSRRNGDIRDCFVQFIPSIGARNDYKNNRDVIARSPSDEAISCKIHRELLNGRPAVCNVMIVEIEYQDMKKP